MMTVSSRSPSVVAPKAMKTLTATYSKPYLAHSSIGPLAKPPLNATPIRCGKKDA